jgi:hypothetical protein
MLFILVPKLYLGTPVTPSSAWQPGWGSQAKLGNQKNLVGGDLRVPPEGAHTGAPLRRSARSQAPAWERI